MDKIKQFLEIIIIIVASFNLPPEKYHGNNNYACCYGANENQDEHSCSRSDSNIRVRAAGTGMTFPGDLCNYSKPKDVLLIASICS